VTDYNQLTPAYQEWILKAITMSMNGDKNTFQGHLLERVGKKVELAIELMKSSN
jgi:hypothetical protein